VVESKNENYAVGAHYLLRAGWRNRVVINPDKEGLREQLHLAVDTGSHPASLNIGVLGMPGSVKHYCLLSRIVCDFRSTYYCYICM